MAARYLALAANSALYNIIDISLIRLALPSTTSRKVAIESLRLRLYYISILLDY